MSSSFPSPSTPPSFSSLLPLVLSYLISSDQPSKFCHLDARAHKFSRTRQVASGTILYSRNILVHLLLLQLFFLLSDCSRKCKKVFCGSTVRFRFRQPPPWRGTRYSRRRWTYGKPDLCSRIKLSFVATCCAALVLGEKRNSISQHARLFFTDEQNSYRSRACARERERERRRYN